MIRFIHKVAIVLMSLATLAIFVTFFLYPANRMVIAVVALIAITIVCLLAQRLGVHRNFWELFFFVEIGLVSLFSIVEWRSTLYLVAFTGVAAAGLITLWSKLAASPAAFLREKPLRRVVVMLVAFGVFAFAAAGQAILTLFPAVSPFLAHTLVGILASYGAYIVWSLYYDGKTIEFLVPAAVIFCLAFEMSLVISLLSIGYLAAGFLISWLWYIAQLFIRFHFGRRDIVWRKQGWFLASNAVLMIGFVYSLRFL